MKELNEQTGDLLRPFVMEREVKQGSVLSPILFLMVMNPLLSSLQQAGIGLSVNDFFAGRFLHADDIQTLSTSIASLDTQISIVWVFAEKNFLKLNIHKCEIIPFSCNSVPHGHESINGLPVVSTAKCLGCWWGRDLFASRSNEENIKKARKAFFSYGNIGAFQGHLNPLSSKSIINTCVMPVLLFGSENWILTEALLHKLETFLGELAKRALKWPRHFSNTAAILALDLETMKSRILCQKLCFLQRLLVDEAVGVGAAAMKSLCDNVELLCLVKECCELECAYGTRFTDDLLSDANCVSQRIIKRNIREMDRHILVQKCSIKSRYIAGVVNRGGAGLNSGTLLYTQGPGTRLAFRTSLD